MAREQDPNEIGALWSKTGGKGEYLTGTIAGQRVVCFKNTSGSEKAPTWRVLKSVPRAQTPAEDDAPW